MATIAEVLRESETGLKGVEEVRFILDTLKGVGLHNTVELDLTLARGLNYYTGAIFEVKALDVEIGSITGGGRYDNLTGIFGMPGLSGVGFSFGADRIYDAEGHGDGRAAPADRGGSGSQAPPIGGARQSSPLFLLYIYYLYIYATSNHGGGPACRPWLLVVCL